MGFEFYGKWKVLEREKKKLGKVRKKKNLTKVRCLLRVFGGVFILKKKTLLDFVWFKYNFLFVSWDKLKMKW